MKKLLFMLVPAFMLGACCNNEPKECPAENAPAEKCQHHCCKDGEHKHHHHEMSEEQKADMAAWEDWANQTDEKKAELLNKRKECVDKKMAEEAEMEAKKAAFKEGIANWDKLSLDEKKALFDNMPCCGKRHGGHEGCGHHGEGEHHCNGNHEGCGHHCDGEHHCDGNHEGCNHQCKHEGEHHCDGNHEGCPNHKN